MLVQHFRINKILLLVTIISLLFNVGLTYSKITKNNKPIEYQFAVTLPDLDLKDFYILVDEEYTYIPQTYFYEKTTNETIDYIQFELLMDGEVIFDVMSGDPFKKYSYTLPGLSALLDVELNADSTLIACIKYAINGNVKEFYEEIELKPVS